MMRRFLPLGIALLLFGAAVVANASVTEAQVAPKPAPAPACDTERYDLTGDGLLSKADMLTWLDQVESRECTLGGTATEGCADLDMDGDGVISYSDARVMYDHFMLCIMGAPSSNAIPGR